MSQPRINNLPNFIIIGAGKSGTTSLYHYLKQHPDVFMSTPKELNFFAFTDEKLDDYSAEERQWVANSITDIDVYHEKFLSAPNHTAVGEASAIYLFHPRAASRIKRVIPDVKLIAILRNPVERAYSGYRMHVRRKTETRGFLQAIHEDLHTTHYLRGSYLQKGFYYEQLKRYYSLFDKEHIRVCLFEDLNTRPVELLQTIYSYLDVDDRFAPDIDKRHNAAPAGKEPLAPPIKEHLIDLCRKDIEKLQTLIGRDLSGWLRV